MTTAKKTVLAIYIILVTLCCVFILCSMFGGLNTHFLTDIVNTFLFGSFGFKVLYAIIFAFFTVFGIFLLFFDFKKPVEKTVKILSLDSGSILISVKAIEELMSRYLSGEKSIKENRSKIIVSDDSVTLHVDLAVYSDTNIPEVTKNLNVGLKNIIENQTGLKVQDVQILVQNILNIPQNGSGVSVK